MPRGDEDLRTLAWAALEPILLQRTPVQTFNRVVNIVVALMSRAREEGWQKGIAAGRAGIVLPKDLEESVLNVRRDMRYY